MVCSEFIQITSADQKIDHKKRLRKVKQDALEWSVSRALHNYTCPHCRNTDYKTTREDSWGNKFVTCNCGRTYKAKSGWIGIGYVTFTVAGLLVSTFLGPYFIYFLMCAKTTGVLLAIASLVEATAIVLGGIGIIEHIRNYRRRTKFNNTRILQLGAEAYRRIYGDCSNFDQKEVKYLGEG